jgi:hypothetical protein
MAMAWVMAMEKQWLRQRAIAAAVAIIYLFDTTIKRRWRG